jgi:hypothetical protein
MSNEPLNPNRTIREPEYIHPARSLSPIPESSPEFECFWLAYPQRAGSNPRPAAFEAWNALIREGVDPADIIAGAERYAVFARSGNPPQLGTRWIMQAVKFLDPKESGWTQDWKPEVHHRKYTDGEISMMRACDEDRAAEGGGKIFGDFFQAEFAAAPQEIEGEEIEGEYFPPARRRIS